MDIKALCNICGQNLAKVVCDNCIAYVCEECFDKSKNLCVRCAKGKQFKKPSHD